MTMRGRPKGSKNKPKTISKERIVTKVGFREHDAVDTFRVWPDTFFGDQFEIVTGDQMKTILWTCNLLSVPVFFFHVCADEWEDAIRIVDMQQLSMLKLLR